MPPQQPQPTPASCDRFRQGGALTHAQQELMRGRMLPMAEISPSATAPQVPRCLARSSCRRRVLTPAIVTPAAHLLPGLLRLGTPDELRRAFLSQDDDPIQQSIPASGDE